MSTYKDHLFKKKDKLLKNLVFFKSRRSNPLNLKKNKNLNKSLDPLNSKKKRRNQLFNKVGKILKDEVFVIQTDTIYGLCGRVNSKNSIIINQLKRRAANQKLITITAAESKNLLASKKILSKIHKIHKWKNLIQTVNTKFIKEKRRVSFLVNVKNGDNSENKIAFRIVNKEETIHEIIKRIGDIYSSSINTSKNPWAKNLKEVAAFLQYAKNVKKFFGWTSQDFRNRKASFHSRPSIIFDLELNRTLRN